MPKETFVNVDPDIIFESVCNDRDIEEVLEIVKKHMLTNRTAETFQYHRKDVIMQAMRHEDGSITLVEFWADRAWTNLDLG